MLVMPAQVCKGRCHIDDAKSRQENCTTMLVPVQNAFRLCQLKAQDSHRIESRRRSPPIHFFFDTVNRYFLCSNLCQVAEWPLRLKLGFDENSAMHDFFLCATPVLTCLVHSAAAGFNHLKCVETFGWNNKIYDSNSMIQCRGPTDQCGFCRLLPRREQ